MVCCEYSHSIRRFNGRYYTREYMQNKRMLLTATVTTVFLVPVIMLSWQHTVTWSGDGTVRLQSSGRVVKAAIDVERKQWLFGAITHTSFHVQQLDWSDKSYSRFDDDCAMDVGEIAVCQTQTETYQIKIKDVPDIHQFQDDDGVEVTAPAK